MLPGSEFGVRLGTKKDGSFLLSCLPDFRGLRIALLLDKQRRKPTSL